MSEEIIKAKIYDLNDSYLKNDIDVSLFLESKLNLIEQLKNVRNERETN